MKRCPDCGFRANDNVCPLCGVRMRPIAAASREIRTHVHQQEGEPCFLPENKQKKKEMQTREKQVRRSRPVSNFQWPTSRRSSKNPNMPKAWQVIGIIVLFSLIRSCAG